MNSNKGLCFDYSLREIESGRIYETLTKGRMTLIVGRRAPGKDAGATRSAYGNPLWRRGTGDMATVFCED